MAEKLEIKPVDYDALAKLFAESGAPLSNDEVAYATKAGILNTTSPKADTKSDAEVVLDETEDSADTDNADDVGTSTDTDNGTESLADNTVEDDEPVVETKKLSDTKTDKKQLTKEQRRIIEQKQEIKEYRTKLAKYENAEALAKYESEYGEKLDADTASEMAKSRLALEQQMKRVELAEFKVEHADILRKYNVMDEAQQIKERSEIAGMTVEEFCRGKFGGVEPIDVQRSKLAAKGQLPSNTNKADFSIANANNASQTKSKTSALTDSERKLRANLERLGFPNITDSEIKTVRKGI